MKQNIATTPEQGKRLLACGVEPKSADMVWQESLTLYGKRRNEIFLLIRDDDHEFRATDTPAWSLSAVLALLPKDLMWQGLYYRLVMGPDEKGWEIEYNDLSVLNNLHRVSADNLIEAAVLMIECLTKEGYKLNEIKQ